MMVKFHNRGSGKGSGPVDYLLGKDRDREGAILLRGDPENTIELIDSLKFAKGYTSGVLSFAEEDIQENGKKQIMDSFEKTLMPGLDADQYQCLWVEHKDKARLELNFVIPNVELTTGKRLQPYYDKADRPRVNAWKNITNDVFKLHDPNDPANRQALTVPSDLPRATQEASKAITTGLMGMVGSGLVSSREDVLRALESGGFAISRETKSSISIENPTGGRNIRLKGALYERDFKFSKEFRAEIEEASREYRESSIERIREAREVYKRGVEIKRGENQQRYKKTQSTLERSDFKGLAMDDSERATHNQREFGSALVVRREDRKKLDRDIEAERSTGQTGSQDIRSRVVRGQDGPLYRPAERVDSKRRLESRRQKSGETGEELSNDRARAAAIERIRDITEHIRTTASRMASRVQEFTDDVRSYIKRDSGLETAGTQLVKSGRELEQTAKIMVKERTRGPSLGR